MFVITGLFAISILLIGMLVRDKKLTKVDATTELSCFKSCTMIPSISKLLILKCVFNFGADFQKIIEMSVEKYGEIFRLKLLGGYNMVFIVNPSMVQKLCMSSQPEHLNKPQLYDFFCMKKLKDGLATSRVELWKVHRGVISKAFTYKGLLRQLNIFEDHAKRFVLTLQESKEMVSVDKHLGKLTFEIVSHVIAGKQVYDLTSEENAQFHANFDRMKEITSYRIMHFVNAVELIWNLNPMSRELDRIQDDIVCYWNKIIVAIRKQFDADAEFGGASDDDMAGKSLVELMINAGFSNEEIFTELSTFLFGGYETTSTTAKLLLFLLASHKKYQDKCREEIDQMFDQMCVSNTNEISMEALNSLTVLDMCIKECLRLYSVVPLFGRQLESSIQLDETLTLPSGTTVFTAPWIMHHNPTLYPEPKKFYPERFSPENVKRRGLGEYIPFSLGPRNCIGYKTATIEVKVIIAYVLRHFEIDSDMSVDRLDRLLNKSLWPFPELGITTLPRQ